MCGNKSRGSECFFWLIHIGIRRRAACRDKTNPPSRRLDYLLPSFLGLLECTGRDQSQIDPVLKHITSNAVRKQIAFSGAAEPFEELGELCLDPYSAGCVELLRF